MVIKKSARALHRLFWSVAVLVLFLVAIYVSVGRYYIDYVEQYQDELVERFVELTGLKLKVGRLYGTWSNLYPTLTFEDVTLFHPEDSSQQVLTMQSMAFSLDVVSTLTTGSIQANGLHISGVSSQVEEFEPGRWRLRGYPYKAGDSSFETMLDRLLLFNDVGLEALRLEMFHADGHQGTIVLDSFRLARSGEFRRARLQLLIGQSVQAISIIIESRGDPRNFDELRAEAYASFDGLNLSGQLSILHTLGLKLRDARLDSELWARLSPGGVVSIKGRVAVPLLDLAAITSRELPDIENISSTFKLERSADNLWTGWISSLEGEINAEAFSFEGLQFSYQDERLKLAAQRLSLDSMMAILLQFNLLEGKGLDALTTLQPVGDLKNMHLEVSTAKDPQRLFLLRSNLDDVSIQPWHGSPGVTGVTGYIEATPSKGTVVLDSRDFTLEFPGIYHSALELGQTRAQLAWRIDKTYVYVDSGPIDIQTDHGPSVGLLRLDLPIDKADGDPMMTLAIGLRDVDAAMRDRYIPYFLSQDLLAWLGDSIQSGRIVDGGFIYRGSLAKEAADERTVQLYLNIEDATLDYHPDWPPVEQLSALVILDDAEVDVTIHSATVSGLSLGQATVELDPLEQGSWLTIKTSAQGAASDAMRIVTQSPGLRRIVGTAFDYWQLTGDISADIELGIPLANESLEPSIKFDALLSNGNLEITDFNLQLTDFAGPLSYSSKTGFSSNGIKGDFFSKPAKLVVSQSRGQPLNVKMNGQVSMKDVAAWTGQPAMVFFAGKMDFLAEVNIGTERSELLLSSQMAGVTIDLPAPYNKAAEQPWPFRFYMPIGESESMLTMSIGDQAVMQLQMIDRQLSSGLLILDNTMDASHEQGLFTITGHLQYAAWDDWYPRYERYLEEAAKGDANGSKENTGLKVRDLYIDHLENFVDVYDDVLLSLTQQPRYWQLDVDTHKIKGRISIAADEADPWVYTLDKFVMGSMQGDSQNPQAIAAMEELVANDGDSGSVFAGTDPSTLQDSDVSVNNLFLGEENLGNIAFSMRINERGLVLEDIVGNIRTVTVGTKKRPGQLSWYQDETGDHSQFKAELRFKNTGDAFERWGFDRTMESKKGRVIVDINWPAKPDQWTLEQSEGQYELALEDGRFLKTTGGASGALKIVSILNISNILRRVQLDFSDIADEGVSFDDIDGGFEIKHGYLEITDPLLIHSPSSQFLFYGGTDIPTEKLDMEMIATLPVAGNLPWLAAAFLGGLPVAAGVFVATKLFEDQVDTVSSAVYTFEGTWDNPELEFKKMFAGDLSKKKAAKVKKASLDDDDDDDDPDTDARKKKKTRKVGPRA